MGNSGPTETDLINQTITALSQVVNISRIGLGSEFLPASLPPSCGRIKTAHAGDAAGTLLL